MFARSRYDYDRHHMNTNKREISYGTPLSYCGYFLYFSA
ncbi:hypothetical protein GBAR_LOCUS29246 [Geodia barretti]|uniref:Uncharacterized protein n=1 Tax=Geodia barretti TaxID=519541 RepID=A0AA35TTK6_GEOBA|nr:hypothetical protein GBAR_LOCUS29246 [Geodia barretti]